MSAKPPKAPKRRLAGLRTFRPGRDRVTGVTLFGMVGVLVAGAAVFGTGAGGAATHLADIGAWLGSSNGTVTHVNGLTGTVDGVVPVAGAGGHRLDVRQDGATVVVTDETTGLTSRIDPAQLTIGQAQDYGQAGIAVILGGPEPGTGTAGTTGANGSAGSGTVAYIEDAQHGTISQVDPVSLAVVGTPLTLPAPLGPAAIDSTGTLWVPVPAQGTVIPVAAGAAGTPVRVGGPGDQLTLTMAAGTPVVTDARTGAVTVVATTGGQQSVNLPPAAQGGTVLTPATTDGSTVPVLAADNGTLVLVDTQTGAATSLTVDAGGHQLGAPQTLGGRIYIPDFTTGSLIVYNTASGQFENRIIVTGHSGKLEVFVKDGLLWVNDEDSAAAAMISPDGKVKLIGKYDTKAPGSAPPTKPSSSAAAPTDTASTNTASNPSSNTATAGPPSSQASDPNGQPTDAPAPTYETSASASAPSPTGTTPKAPGSPPSSSTSASAPSTTPSTTTPAGSPSTTTAPPQAPGTVTATSGAGYITISFAPAGGGATPTGYQLLDIPAGASVTENPLPARGKPFLFKVTGGSCDQTYSFVVAALYSGGQQVKSAPSVKVRPCVMPGTPQNLKQGAPVEHGANLSWSPPVNAGTTALTYEVHEGTKTLKGGITGTSTAIGGLTNFTMPTISVVARNAAGQSKPAATLKLNIAPAKLHSYQTHNRKDVNGGNGPLYVRGAPDTSTRVATIGANDNPTITVVCQVHGEHISDTYYKNIDSYVWDKVEWEGGYAYIADPYLTTPNSNQNTYSDPPIWRCS